MKKFPSDLVVDANILIDLDISGLLKAKYRLGNVWRIADITFENLLDKRKLSVKKFSVKIESLPGTLVKKVYDYHAKNPRISHDDLTALVLARDKNLLLLTGDKDLRSLAEDEGIVVHGTLWLLDLLIREGVLKQDMAAKALRNMLENNRRLPRWEVEIRLKKWKDN